MDKYDKNILQLIQNDSERSIAELAERIGLTANPCWRRVQKLQEQGYIKKKVTLLNPAMVNLGVTVFVHIRTRHHSKEWVESFKSVINAIPEVTEFYRMAGTIDYMLKILVPSIKGYDDVYQKIIAQIELEDVSALFAMEEVKHTTSLPLKYC